MNIAESEQQAIIIAKTSGSKEKGPRIKISIRVEEMALDKIGENLEMK